MSRAVPEPARQLAAELQRQFGRDAELAKQLNDAHRRFSQANDRLRWGIHPDGLAAIYEGVGRGQLCVLASDHSAWCDYASLLFLEGAGVSRRMHQRRQSRSQHWQ